MKCKKHGIDMNYVVGVNGQGDVWRCNRCFEESAAQLPHDCETIEFEFEYSPRLILRTPMAFAPVPLTPAEIEKIAGDTAPAPHKYTGILTDDFRQHVVQVAREFDFGGTCTLREVDFREGEYGSHGVWRAFASVYVRLNSVRPREGSYNSLLEFSQLAFVPETLDSRGLVVQDCNITPDYEQSDLRVRGTCYWFQIVQLRGG